MNTILKPRFIQIISHIKYIFLKITLAHIRYLMVSLILCTDVIFATGILQIYACSVRHR